MDGSRRAADPDLRGIRFCAVLIAGGNSTRMGTDKAGLEIGGVPLWRLQIEKLRGLSPAELFISGRREGPWRDSGVAVVEDQLPGAGPLAGIAAALEVTTCPLVLALAVDLPVMTSAYLGDLLFRCEADRGLVPLRGGRYEPLAAIYPASCGSIAKTLLRTSGRSLQEFVVDCVARDRISPLPVDPDDSDLFLNVNYPADLTHGALSPFAPSVSIRPARAEAATALPFWQTRKRCKARS